MYKTFIKTISVCLILFGFCVPLNAQETETSQKPKRRVLPIPQVPSQQGVNLQKNYNGHSYRFMPNKKTWHEAQKDAESLGGYLVVITDKEEDEFVLQLIRDANSGETPHVWIGLTDQVKEGELRWVNGDETVYWRNSPNKFSPSDDGDEDFVHYYAAPAGAQEINWNDNTGTHKFAYIIECDQERPETVLAKSINESEIEESNKNLKPLTGKTYYGYEDDKSFVYAMFLNSTPDKGVVELTYTLPFYDQKYRGDAKYKVTKNDSKNIEMIRGNPPEWIYEAQIDSSGNLLNGKRFKVKDGKRDSQDAVWNLYKVR